MTSNKHPRTPRINVQIDEELDKKLDKFIPPGMKSTLIRTIMEVLVTEVERDGKGVLGIVLGGKFSFSSGVQNLNEATKEPKT